jgi:hypothetical protein
MIAIGKTIVSEEVLTERFVCHIEKCKAACCIEGDAGAPLSVEECDILEAELPLITPFLSKEGVASIADQGTWVRDQEGEPCTPLNADLSCSYSFYDDKGVLQCGIEKAWEAGKTQFRKPISCHLYPIRVKEYAEFTAVNYHRWYICQPACALGSKLGVPVFRFLKEALVRKFGMEWYSELEVHAMHNAEKGTGNSGLED